MPAHDCMNQPLRNLAPKLVDKQLILDDDGNIVLVNGIQWEAQARVTSVVGDWIYDPQFGSRLPETIGKRGIPSRSQVTSDVYDALLPMVRKGLIRQDIEIKPLVFPGTIKVDVRMWDSQDDEISFSI